MITYHLSSKGITEAVEADDQWGAWDTLRDYPVEAFGLVVTAQPEGTEEGDRIPVRTDTLMLRWNRHSDAAAFTQAAAERGLV